MEIFKLSDDSSLSRKDRERLFKRREILLAACKIFSEKGFELATLDEIAEASEYGKGTLYNYFQNKEDIYNALLEAILLDYVEILKNISSSSDNLYDFMYKVTESLFKYSINNENTFLLLINMRGNLRGDEIINKFEKIKILIEEINAIYLKFIDDAIDKNIIRNIDKTALLVLYRNMMFAYIYHLKYCKKVEEISIQKETEFLLDLWFNGIKN